LRRWKAGAVSLAVWTTLAMSSYFVATGLVALVEVELLSSPDVVSPPHAVAGRTTPPRKSPSDKAKVILERNPFDSVTGPLGVSPIAVLPQPPAAPQDPLTAPQCEGVHVFSTVESLDRRWSSAVIQGPGEPRGVVR
jgi:general secretion pathway protein C